MGLFSTIFCIEEIKKLEFCIWLSLSPIKPGKQNYAQTTGISGSSKSQQAQQYIASKKNVTQRFPRKERSVA